MFYNPPCIQYFNCLTHSSKSLNCSTRLLFVISLGFSIDLMGRLRRMATIFQLAVHRIHNTSNREDTSRIYDWMHRKGENYSEIYISLSNARCLIKFTYWHKSSYCCLSSPSAIIGVKTTHTLEACIV